MKTLVTVTNLLIQYCIIKDYMQHKIVVSIDKVVLLLGLNARFHCIGHSNLNYAMTISTNIGIFIEEILIIAFTGLSVTIKFLHHCHSMSTV